MLGAFAIYGVIALFLLIPIVFFLFSVVSRKTYRCAQCGEQITTEYLDAQHCNMCGAPLNKTET